jgi:MoaA/NifB/PqqE/SkfB family radical SAM enzyme
MDNKTISYTAANSIPVKIFKNNDLVQSLNRGHIPPVHVQIIPTNKCNLKCSFCSCKKRNKNDELSLDQIKTLCDDLEFLGCKSTTITGGGEPLMHPDIKQITECLCEHNIKIGFVTNGILLHKLTPYDFDNITWCRISCSDERSFDKAKEVIEVAAKCGRNVDWAFSYVIGKDFNPANLNKYIAFANQYDFTHVRVVSDLLDLDHCDNMENIKSQVTEDDSRVIYQGRKVFDAGVYDCRIALLKPVVGADGYIYPCCGVQYAHEQEDMDNPESMRMGRIERISEIITSQKPFDGTHCYRCYYKNYNDILRAMVSPMDHVKFV